MTLIRNKTSGKYFIVLETDDEPEDHLLLITPEGRVKRLEKRLFEDPVAVDPRAPAWVKRLGAEQLAKYEAYLETLSPRG
ncbi:MAG TPA: hypothetical protein ENF48_01925 [Desulfobacteraceae bacterium]|nr:MAG: hypothetical protein DRH76_06120 [Deltaproteobacteria bacterium]HDI59110.1 hypothetical protein [Desulfobacteraceae bacterium]